MGDWVIELLGLGDFCFFVFILFLVVEIRSGGFGWVLMLWLGRERIIMCVDEIGV